jgi:pimeloyl-ACP methyl ester carboxylesterase
VVKPELSFEVHPGTGPYALLVHGVLASRSLWMRNLAALGEVCRPVVVELWGHGGATLPSDVRSYQVAGYVAEFDSLRQHLGAERWLVCGQSMGGALVLNYALTHPERVSAAVFTNAMSALSSRRAWDETVVPDAAREADLLEQEGRAQLDRNAMNPARNSRLSAEIRARLQDEWALHRLQGIAGTFRWTTPELPVRDRLGQLEPPAMLVYGVRETRFAPLADVARRKLPSLEVAEVDAGHAVNLGDPAGFNRAFCTFVSRYL